MKFVFLNLSKKIPDSFIKAVLQTIPSNWEVSVIRETQGLMKILSNANYIMGFSVPFSFLKSNTQLKGFFLLSSQVPESYQKLNCELINIKGLNSSSVAQHTLYLTMKSIRERTLPLATESLTLSIMGFGHIGKSIFDTHKNIFSQIEILSRQTDAGFPLVSYEKRETFLESADILIIALDLNSETKAMFTPKSFFKYLKRDITIINVARGELFDEKSLVTFFNKNMEAQYLTDVTFPEPYPIDAPLRGLENIFITDHQAGFNSKTWAKTLEKWKAIKWIK